MRVKALICLLIGHREIRVREVGMQARPDGILPSLDGYVVYEADESGDHLACKRCRHVRETDQ